MKVLKRKTVSRPKISLQPFECVAHFNDHTEKKVRVERYRYGTSYPMSWESGLFDMFYRYGIKYYGEEFSGGMCIGFEDMKVANEVIESIAVEKDAQVLATFAPLKAGVVATPRTMYVARDLSWSGNVMEKLIDAAVRRSGIRRFAWVTDMDGGALPNIDIGVFTSNAGKHLIIVTCSDRLYEWDGVPVRVRIHILSLSPFTDILSGEQVQVQETKSESIIEREFAPGEVLCLLER